MSWFRFKVINGDETTHTQWQEETTRNAADPNQLSTVAALKKIRAASPDAAVTIERRNDNPNTDVNGR